MFSVAAPRPNTDMRRAIPNPYPDPMPAVLLLAHQGGWDEIVLVAAPIVVFGGLLLVARRRALTQAHNRGEVTSE